MSMHALISVSMHLRPLPLHHAPAAFSPTPPKPCGIEYDFARPNFKHEAVIADFKF
jgi:hypothetical protein